MKKFFTCIAVLALAFVSLCGLTSCDKGNGVEVYVQEAKYNSEEINMWRNLYLLDEDTYVLTVKALDSKDSSKVTLDFYMIGSYTREENVVTITLGDGTAKALNGDTPITLPAAGLYGAAVGVGTVFTLDGSTFTLSE